MHGHGNWPSTGDHASTASTIGGDLSLPPAGSEPVAITGAELDAMHDDELRARFAPFAEDQVGVRPTMDGPETTVLVRQSGDEGWWILGAASENIVVTQPVAGDVLTSPVGCAVRHGFSRERSTSSCGPTAPTNHSR